MIQKKHTETKKTSKNTLYLKTSHHYSTLQLRIFSVSRDAKYSHCSLLHFSRGAGEGSAVAVSVLPDAAG